MDANYPFSVVGKEATLFRKPMVIHTLKLVATKSDFNKAKFSAVLVLIMVKGQQQCMVMCVRVKVVNCA